MSWGVSPRVYPVWDSLGFLDLDCCFLPHFREVFNYYLLGIFSWPFFLPSSSGTPMIQMLGHLTLSQRSLRLSSFLLILYSFFLSASFISTVLSSTALILSLPQLFYCWFPPECFWSQLLDYSLLIDSFVFLLGPSRLNFSCIFSILVSKDYQVISNSKLSVTPFFFQNFESFLLSLFWILFQLDSLSPPLLFGLVGFYHVSLHAE